jgi:hypothetical protein
MLAWIYWKAVMAIYMCGTSMIFSLGTFFLCMQFFYKALTTSDTITHGGFSVPRCVAPLPLLWDDADGLWIGAHHFFFLSIFLLEFLMLSFPSGDLVDCYSANGSLLFSLVSWFVHGLSHWWLLIKLSKRGHLGMQLTTLGRHVVYSLYL